MKSHNIYVLFLILALLQISCESSIEGNYQPGLNGENTAPVLSGITTQSTGINTAKNVSFSISDSENALTCSSAHLSMTSSNNLIVANSSVTWSGTPEGGCTARITPTAGRMGATTLTFRVTDGTLSTQRSFAFNVKSISGSGTMAALTQSAALSTTGATRIVAGDFNGDSYPDVAIVTAAAVVSGLEIHLNNRSGGFTFSAAFALGSFITGLQMGDLNADGNIDLITESGTNLHVLLGNGNGTFVNPVNYNLGVANGNMQVGDFNEDGKKDVVIGGNTQLRILMGNGDGTLQAATTFGAAVNFYDVASADFNHDGHLDLIAAADNRDVYAYLGVGNGTFSAGTLYASPQAGGYTEFIDVGDIDGDGDLDWVSADGNHDVAYVHENNGSGVFTVHAAIATGLYPGDCKLVDVDDDAIVDLICSNYTSSTLTIKKGHGDFTFTALSTPAAGGGAWGLIPEDFNRDGKTDFAIACYDDSKLGLLLGN